MSVEAHVAALIEILDTMRGPGVLDFNACVAAMHHLSTALEEARLSGASHDELKTACAPAISLLGESPFIRRLQTWPRGYQGDFETIEQLIEQQSLVATSARAFQAERYALGSMIAQQHRNKIKMQADCVMRACYRASEAERRPRIFVIACGGCSDLMSIAPVLVATRADVWINDIDLGAIHFSEARLRDAGVSLNAVPGNALTQLRAFAKLEPFDLIVTGGLFDYLSDRHAGILVRAVTGRLLNHDGRMIVTNLAPNNPFQTFIEIVFDWTMTYREESQIEAYLSEAGIDASRVRHSRDSSGLAIVTEIRPASTTTKSPARTVDP